jgi:hypothetical protein
MIAQCGTQKITFYKIFMERMDFQHNSYKNIAAMELNRAKINFDNCIDGKKTN